MEISKISFGDSDPIKIKDNYSFKEVKSFIESKHLESELEKALIKKAKKMNSGVYKNFIVNFEEYKKRENKSE